MKIEIPFFKWRLVLSYNEHKPFKAAFGDGHGHISDKIFLPKEHKYEVIDPSDPDITSDK